MPKASKSPLRPRLPAARALRRLAHVVLEDDAAPRPTGPDRRAAAELRPGQRRVAGSAIDRTELIGGRITGLDVAEMIARSVVLRDCAVTLASFRFATLTRVTFEGCVDFRGSALDDLRIRAGDIIVRDP